jgi:hypothetical protein
VCVGSEARKSDERSEGGLEQSAEYKIIGKRGRGKIEDPEGLLEGGKCEQGGHIPIGKGKWEDLQELLITAGIWERKEEHK